MALRVVTGVVGDVFSGFKILGARSLCSAASRGVSGDSGAANSRGLSSDAIAASRKALTEYYPTLSEVSPQAMEMAEAVLDAAPVLTAAQQATVTSRYPSSIRCNGVDTFIPFRDEAQVIPGFDAAKGRRLLFSMYSLLRGFNVEHPSFTGPKFSIFGDAAGYVSDVLESYEKGKELFASQAIVAPSKDGRFMDAYLKSLDRVIDAGHLPELFPHAQILTVCKDYLNKNLRVDSVPELEGRVFPDLRKYASFLASRGFNRAPEIMVYHSCVGGYLDDENLVAETHALMRRMDDLFRSPSDPTDAAGYLPIPLRFRHVVGDTVSRMDSDMLRQWVRDQGSPFSSSEYHLHTPEDTSIAGVNSLMMRRFDTVCRGADQAQSVTIHGVVFGGGGNPVASGRQASSFFSGGNESVVSHGLMSYALGLPFNNLFRTPSDMVCFLGLMFHARLSMLGEFPELKTVISKDGMDPFTKERNLEQIEAGLSHVLDKEG